MTTYCFYLQVWKDVPQADWCLTELRKHFPNSRVILLSDGDDDERWGRLGLKHRCEVVIGSRRFPLGFGGEMVNRMLLLYLQEELPRKKIVALNQFTKPMIMQLDSPRTTEDFLVKIDTDTGVHRSFAFPPPEDGVSGTVQRRTYQSVQGGCIVIPRRIAEKFVQRKAFLEPDLADYEKTWCRGDKWLTEWTKERGLIAEDWMIGWVANRCGVRCLAWPEVCCSWQERIENADRFFAITHPCKDMKL